MKNLPNKKVFLKIYEGLYVKFQKAKTTKYIKKIKIGNKTRYFYTQKELKDYKESGFKPDREKKEKGLLSGIMSFFGFKDEKMAKEKVHETFTANKEDLKGVAESTFTDYMNEYLSNKDKWDKKFSKKEVVTKDKKTGKIERKKTTDKTAVMSSKGKSWNLSLMKKVAGIVGGGKDGKSGVPKELNILADVVKKEPDFDKSFKIINDMTGLPKETTDKFYELFREDEKGHMKTPKEGWKAFIDMVNNEQKDSFETMPEGDLGNIGKPREMTDKQIENNIQEAMKLSSKQLRKNQDLIDKQLDMASSQNKDSRVFEKLETMREIYTAAFDIKEFKDKTPKDWVDNVKSVSEGYARAEKQGDKSPVAPEGEKKTKGRMAGKPVDKREFQAYLSTEKQLNDMISKMDQHKDFPEDYKRFEESADAFEKKLRDQVSAASQSYGITSDEFIDQLNKYDERKKGIVPDKPSDKSPVMLGEEKKAENMTKKEFLNAIKNADEKIFSGIQIEDWGTLRGQGKRVKGQVVGGMRDASLQGKKEYVDKIQKLSDNKDTEELSEFWGQLNPAEQSDYLKTRSAGFDHDTALKYMWMGEKAYDKIIEDKKSPSDKDKPLQKASQLLIEALNKAKAMPVGTVSKDGKSKKMPDGSWKPVTEGKKDKKPEEEKKPEKKEEKTPAQVGKDAEKKETIKNALKKIANILAEALSGKDIVAPTGAGIEETGEGIKSKAKDKKVKVKNPVIKKKDEEKKK